MLMVVSLFARKLVMWPYSSCMVCIDVCRRKPTMEDDDRVVDTNWICLARMMMLHCLSPTPTYFVSRNTSALLIFDNIFSLPSNAHRLGLCTKSICFYINLWEAWGNQLMDRCTGWLLCTCAMVTMGWR